MIFGSFERLVAFRYLRARRQEGFISVIAGFSLLGIALGVATLIIVTSVMDGFTVEIRGLLLSVRGDVNVYGMSGAVPDYGPLADKIKAVPGVTAARPLIGGQVLVSTAARALGGNIRGEAIPDIKSQHAIADHIDAGRLDDLDDASVLLGDRLAASLGVHPGDVVSLLSSDDSRPQLGSQLHSESYRVAATFGIGEYNFDNATIIMPIAAAQKFFGVGEVATSIEVFTVDADRAAAIAWAIRDAIGPQYRVADWTLSLTGYLNELATQRNVLSLILTLIIMVAAFNIVSGMMMLVKDKARDIAILRSMGATQGMVLRIFCLTGSAIGIVGTLLGLGLGIAFADNIEAIRQIIQHLTGTDLFDAKVYFLSHLPVRLAPVKIAAIVAAAFALSFVATLYPSWRAARRDPVEALRLES